MNQFKSMTSVNKPVTQINSHQDQFQYLGRWVDKKNFRAFVYDKDGKETLANSYKEFESLTGSGIWFASKPSEPDKGKLKNASLPNSK